MSKTRRGNLIFLSWAGDHTPKHVHVYKDSKLVLKWDLENEKVMKGKSSKKLIEIIQELQIEGKL